MICSYHIIKADDEISLKVDSLDPSSDTKSNINYCQNFLKTGNFFLQQSNFAVLLLKNLNMRFNRIFH